MRGVYAVYDNTKMQDIQINFKHGVPLRRLVPLFMLIGIYAVFSMLSPAFLQWNTAYNLMQQNSILGIIALGTTFVLITGGIDFTAGYGLAMVGVTTAKIYMSTGENIIIMIFCAVILGTVIGLVNGLVITKLKIQPFIATLAMMTILQGLTMIIGEANTPQLTKKDVLFIGNGTVFGFPAPFFIFIGMSFISAFILYKTRMGIYTYAIGGNEEAAKSVGVNANKTKLLVYMYAGICTGMASMIMISRVVIVMPNMSGTLLLDGIASAVIGGTSVSGG
ncbi:MAG: ABC transporter permease, partial [Prevotella sp.]|nr:ABC transporter permease [Prevotella sp.]